MTRTGVKCRTHDGTQLDKGKGRWQIKERYSAHIGQCAQVETAMDEKGVLTQLSCRDKIKVKTNTSYKYDNVSLKIKCTPK